MTTNKRWYFSKENLENTPSRRDGIDAAQELCLRQEAANLIQEIGMSQGLKLTQLCISTGIVYLQRFYMFHSLSKFHWSTTATAALFLATKVENQPRKLDYFLKECNKHFSSGMPVFETIGDQMEDLCLNENILLQTMAFDVGVDHPYTHIITYCQNLTDNKELAKAAYFMACNSFLLTTFCIEYPPEVVAAFCMFASCKWSEQKISAVTDDKKWIDYFKKTITSQFLDKLTSEFFFIYNKYPSKLKEKYLSILTKKCIKMDKPQIYPKGQVSSNSLDKIIPNKNHNKQVWEVKQHSLQSQVHSNSSSYSMPQIHHAVNNHQHSAGSRKRFRCEDEQSLHGSSLAKRKPPTVPGVSHIVPHSVGYSVNLTNQYEQSLHGSSIAKCKPPAVPGAQNSLPQSTENSVNLANQMITVRKSINCNNGQDQSNVKLDWSLGLMDDDPEIWNNELWNLLPGGNSTEPCGSA